MTEAQEELRFIELCSDTTFKYLYKNERCRKWFNNIIKSKFNLDLDNYTLVDNELNTGNKKKDYRLDINLKKDDINIIIEMNNSYYDFLNSKNYQYLYRIAGSLYQEGENYSNKQAKLVLFNNFKNKKLPDIKTGNFILEDPINNLVIDDIESFEIYLPNFENICYHNANKEDISLSLFTCKSYDEMKARTNNPDDLEIIKELERLAMDENFIFDYDVEKVRKKTENSIRLDGYHAGVEEGIKEGLEKGSREEKLNIAKSMLDEKIDIKIISKCTDLSIEEIDKLK